MYPLMYIDGEEIAVQNTVHYGILGHFSTAYRTAPKWGHEKWKMQSKPRETQGSTTKIYEVLRQSEDQPRLSLERGACKDSLGTKNGALLRRTASWLSQQ